MTAAHLAAGLILLCIAANVLLVAALAASGVRARVRGASVRVPAQRRGGEWS